MPISNLGNGLRTGVCTSTNRPTTPYEGQVIYETDTDLVYLWNGTAWVEIVSALTKAPRGIMTAVVTATTTVNLTTSAVTQLTSASFTAVTGRLYRITYVEPRIRSTTAAGDNSVSAIIFNGATQLNEAYGVSFASTTVFAFVSAVYVGALTAGATVIRGKALATSTTGTPQVQRSASSFAFLLIEDIGAS